MTNLAKLLESAYNSIKRRSLIFLVSDFICLPGWDRAMDRLNRKHDLLAVRLWDPREARPSRRRRSTRRGLGDGRSIERRHERQGIPAEVPRRGAPSRSGAGKDLHAVRRGPAFLCLLRKTLCWPSSGSPRSAAGRDGASVR